MTSITVLILSTKTKSTPIEMDNHSLQDHLRKVQEEILNVNYIEVDNKPLIASSLGAIPKSDAGVRLIHV